MFAFVERLLVPSPLVLLVNGAVVASMVDCAFVASFSLTSKPMAVSRPCGRKVPAHERKAKSWGIADDWSSLSSDHPSNATPDSDSIFNVNLAAKAAQELKASKGNGSSSVSENDQKISAEDSFVEDTVEFIHNHLGDPSDPPLYDTKSSFESYSKSVHFLDDAGKEISLLVRCNEAPEELLVQEGRALAPLTDEEKYDSSQLFTETTKEDGSKNYEPTGFFKKAVSKIFRVHAVLSARDGDREAFLDSSGVAQWMTKSLGDTEVGAVGRHDKRVTAVISKYGTYGSGRLTESEFMRLYLDAVTSASDTGKRRHAAPVRKADPTMRQLKLKPPSVETVWRDFRNHGILFPVEEERARREKELRDEYGAASPQETHVRSKDFNTLMDECEILSWGGEEQYNLNSMQAAKSSRERGSDYGSKSSYELVELASDNTTPKRIRDGEFVFIDEESCIGCAQCAQIAPSSFVMLESGRARTFSQSNAPDVPMAVSACPVNCMHNVAFHELKEMEQSRDNGDGRTDHKHMGRPRGHTPLNVAGIDSDANHKSSWYHYLKQKCYMSKSCPQRGCYDCPAFSSPGDNPHFKERHRKAEALRAKDIISSGEADFWRKTAEL